MLLWNEWHPYNSVHAVRVMVPLDRPRLDAAVNRTLQARGLGNLRLDTERGTFQYQGEGAKYEIKVVSLGDDPHAGLAAEMERQLNTPFIHNQNFNPFRFFVAPGQDSFLLGMAFFHAIADGASAVHLLAGIVAAYCGKENALPAPNLYPRRYDGILLRDPGLFIRKILAVAGGLCVLRRTRRVPVHQSQESGTAVTFFPLSPAEWQALRRTGKTWNVTVNDLFLALLLQSLARQLPPKPPASRRTKLAVGCIVNLRKELGLPAPQTFGLFLGSFVVSCEPRADLPLPELARAVRQQTARIKRHRLFVGTPLELRLARLGLRFFSVARQRKFYLKNYPLWGGITNLNLDSLWPQPAGERRADYFRAVSPGPATPLVLSITTTGDGGNIGLSHRTEVFSTAQVERIKRDFLAAVRDL